MALVNSAFTVNVTPGAMPPTVHVSEYDIGRTYTVTINGENGGAFVIPTGASATIEGTLNGSVGFTQSATISNNQVSFALSESMTAYSGKAWCKIKLTLNNQPIQTCAFVLAVDRAGVEAETVIGASGFEEQIREAVEDIVEGGGTSHAVLYTPMSLTPAQQGQARENIGAASMSDIPSLAAYRTASAQDAIDAAQDSAIAAKYTKPSGGIPDSDIASAATWNAKGSYSKPSGGIPKSDLAAAVQTSLGKADTALQQHQSLSAYRTAATQDLIDNSKLDKNQGSANVGKMMVVGNDGNIVPKAEEYLFVDAIPSNADHAAKYVLPDGYIYTWQEKTEYNANNGNALLNMKPNTNARYDSVSAQSGVLTSDLIPWDESWTQWNGTPTAISIRGIDSLVPAYNSPIIVYYYHQDGSYKTAMLASQMHSLGTPSNSDPITLPVSFNLADLNLYPINDIGYVRVLLGISTSGNISAEDVAGLKISVPFYDSGPAESGWYSTGVKYATTEQLESQITELQDNEIKVSTNQILYAVGDSITYGYGVGGNSGSWVHYVITRNGYDAVNSRNLGESNLGFCTTSVSNHTIQDIVGGTNFSGADIVTVALGINDWKSSGATLTAFWAGMQYCFNKIRTDNPYCKLFYILPFNVAIGNSSYANFYGLGFVGDSDPTKPYSYKLQTFINMIKDKLEEPAFKAFHINVIDMVECAAINRQNITTALSDGLHPTAETQAELGKEIARRIVLADETPGVMPVYTGGVS